MLWKFPIDASVWYNFDISFNNKFFVVATANSGIYIIDKKGKLVDYLSPEQTSPGYPSPFVDEDENLYFVDELFNLSCYNIRNKEEKWTLSLPEVCEYPIIGFSNHVVVCYRNSGKICSYSKEKGTLLWTFKIQELIRQQFSYVKNDSYLVFSMQNKIWFIDHMRGKIIKYLTHFNEVKLIGFYEDRLLFFDSSKVFFYNVNDDKPIILAHLEKGARNVTIYNHFLWIIYDNGINRISLNILLF